MDKLVSFDMCIYLWSHHNFQDNKHIHHLQELPECALYHSLLPLSNPRCSEAANDLCSHTTEQCASSIFILFFYFLIYYYLFLNFYYFVHIFYFYINKITQYLLLFPPEFIYIVCNSNLFLLYWWAVFHWVNRPKFTYLFTCDGHLGCFLFRAITSKASTNTSVQVFVQTGVVRTYNIHTFNFLNAKVFCKVAASFYISILDVWKFELFHILANT